MVKKVIAIVEDEKDLNTLVKRYLEKEGYEVRSYLTYEEASAHTTDDDIHLWILDIMLDDKSQVIYVGKAKKLKNRVSSYFHGEHLPKVQAMVDKVADFNVIVAGSEFEALVLENSLIKRHKPR